MRPVAIVLFVSTLLIVQSCSSQPATTPAPAAGESATPSPTPSAQTVIATSSQSPLPAAAKSKIDPCSLLTSAEIQAVQGEPLKNTIPSERPSGDLVTLVCYYELPTPSNSISLSVTLRGADKKGGQSVKEFWETTFAKSERQDGGKKDRDKGKKKAQPSNEPRREGDEDESASAQPVRGIGEEAFWSASRVGGALYVLRGDRFLRISVGGNGDAEAKLKKSRTLAEKVLRRL